LLYVQDRLVTPSPVYIERGKFIVEGVMYG